MINPHLEGNFSDQKKLINELYAYHNFAKPVFKKSEQMISALVFFLEFSS